jgi:hypothetical protein
MPSAHQALRATGTGFQKVCIAAGGDGTYLGIGVGWYDPGMAYVGKGGTRAPFFWPGPLVEGCIGVPWPRQYQRMWSWGVTFDL